MPSAETLAYTTSSDVSGACASEGGIGTLILVAGRYVCWHSAHAVVRQALSVKAGSAWATGSTLLARLLLLTRRNEISVTDVATVPAGEGPVIYNLGIHHHLDVHVEERND